MEEECDRISRAQSLAVRAGTVLQKVIKQLAPYAQYQAQLKDPSRHRILRADIIINDLAIELKLGYMFDTKKAAKEVEDIQQFARLLSVREQREILPAICLFQAESQDDMKAFKADTEGVMMLNGTDLCSLLGIEYRDVLNLVRDSARNMINAQ